MCWSCLCVGVLLTCVSRPALGGLVPPWKAEWFSMRAGDDAHFLWHSVWWQLMANTTGECWCCRGFILTCFSLLTGCALGLRRRKMSSPVTRPQQLPWPERRDPAASTQGKTPRSPMSELTERLPTATPGELRAGGAVQEDES